MPSPFQQTAFAYQPAFMGTTNTPGLVLRNAVEPMVAVATAATGTVDYDVCQQSVLYFTANASANWTLNLRGGPGIKLDTLMKVNQVVTVVHAVTQGASAYYNNVIQVDGVTLTAKWQGGSAPSTGNSSSVDIYSYAILKTAPGTFSVFASQTKFA